MLLRTVPEIPAGFLHGFWSAAFLYFQILHLPEDNASQMCVPDSLLSSIGESFFFLRDEDGGKQSQENEGPWDSVIRSTSRPLAQSSQLRGGLDGRHFGDLNYTDINICLYRTTACVASIGKMSSN